MKQRTRKQDRRCTCTLAGSLDDASLHGIEHAVYPFWQRLCLDLRRKLAWRELSSFFKRFY
jgi:hypothetical protein